MIRANTLKLLNCVFIWKNTAEMVKSSANKLILQTEYPDPPPDLVRQNSPALKLGQVFLRCLQALFNAKLLLCVQLLTLS